MQRSQPPPSDVLAQLERLQRSAQFADCNRLTSFLRFVVEETLAGHAATLKETVIGAAVYKRDASYDTRIDPIVRVEARRLRSKLQNYYANEGKLDPVVVAMPVGGYVAVFGGNANAGRSGPPMTAHPCNAVGEHRHDVSLAIMPIRVLSADPRDLGFADGLTDELMFSLSRARGVRVVSRAITFQYRSRTYSPAALSRRHGIHALLQGTLRRQGDVVRVTLELCDPCGYALCSDRFDARGDDPMESQELIAATVLSRIQLCCSPACIKRADTRPTALEAMARVYRARQFRDQQTPGALHHALELFLQASSAEPACAQAYAGIAGCHCDLFRLGYLDREAAMRAARPAAMLALQCDPSSAETHKAIGTITAWLDGDPETAESAFQRALQLGESARAARLYGGVLAVLDRHEEAAQLFREARCLEPFSCHQDIVEASSYFQARRFEELIRPARHNTGHSPCAENLVLRALAHIFTGDFAGAESLIAPIAETAAADPTLLLAQAEIEAWLGAPQRGMRLIQSGTGRATCYAQATLAAALGDEDRCLEALAESVERREFASVWLRTDTRFDRLRDSPRFARLQRLQCT